MVEKNVVRQSYLVGRGNRNERRSNGDKIYAIANQKEFLHLKKGKKGQREIEKENVVEYLMKCNKGEKNIKIKPHCCHLSGVMVQNQKVQIY